MAYHADSSDLEVKEILTWEGFGVASRELAQQIVNSGFKPDIIIAVARGGLLPAGALSYAMGVKLSDAINVEFYTDVEETLPDPVLLEPLLDVDSIRNKKLLVVDDVADSGRTLALVLDLLTKEGADCRSAVLYTVSPVPRSPRITCGSAPTIGSSSPGLLKSPSRHSKTQGRGGLVDVSDYEPAGARISGLQRRRV